MKCPKCNHELPDDSGFCTECGTNLDDAVKAAEEPVVEASAAEESAAEAPAEPPVEEPAIEEPAPAEQLPEVPEKKSKTGLIIGAVAAVILAAIGIFMAIGGGGDPKETVINAFKSVYSAETVYPIEELFGFEEMAKASVEGKYESGMSFILSGLDPAMDADMLLGGGITIDAQSDTPNKKSAATVGIEYNDMSLVSMDLYVDDTNMMVKIPEMSDTVFTLNYKDDLAGQIANSPYIGQMLAEEDRAMAEQYFATLSEAIEQSSNAGSAYPFDFEALWNRYKEGTQAIETLKTAMTVEKGSKKTCVVDLQETDCAGYQVTIPAGEVVKFIETTADFFLNDETFKTEFLTYMEQTMRHPCPCSWAMNLPQRRI
ncbi:MAG: zinc ribbon domain-containing protein [Lachnospiraceae bacterium]